MARYLAVVRRDDDNDEYVIRSPDFPEVEAQCDDVEEAVETAREIIREETHRLEAEGRRLPPPTPKASFEARPAYRECFLVAVEAGSKRRSRRH